MYTYVYMCVYICVCEYYSAIKNNKTLPFAIAGMDLKGIVLGEISQEEKDKHLMISYM